MNKQTQEKFKIKNLVIIKDNGSRVVYEPKDHFFKCACPEGTEHDAVESMDGMVTIY